ncbi:MAG: YerC/YecD family TrpR-related protein [Clostridia bacterium]|nr:YerC/YecD family TrpR-related protein [Clostridia bacterium]
MKNFHDESTERLFKVISEISSPEECSAFFEDICTIKEIMDMAQRLDTAILLDGGSSYQKIADEVGVSTATISRVNRCLNYGAGGYRTAIDKLNGDKNGNK